MSSEQVNDELLDKLFEDFAHRCRAGEQPALDEYAEKYPQLANAIREVFPALQVIEQFAPRSRASTGPYAAQPDERPVPQKLGEYQLVREVGRGGMGIVFEAVQESLKRRVAVKVLPPHPLMAPSQLHRFQLEARTGAQLHHTHIVPVYGVGEQEGVHYYAMEFIQGESLDKVIDEVRRQRGKNNGLGPLPRSEQTTRVAARLLSAESSQPQLAVVREDAKCQIKASTDAAATASTATFAVKDGDGAAGQGPSSLSSSSGAHYFRRVAQVGLQAAEALAYAHRYGVLHRDVKPSNLLLDIHAHIWVADFGLAKIEGAAGVTRTGEAAGTLMYMAPERFEGRSEPSSDIYGLGATLYELLTLEPPFKESSKVRLIERIRQEEPKRPRKADPQIPRDLETIVLKAMDKDPARRYATADDLAKDLECYLSDRPVQARRTSAAERAWRWCRRNPLVAALTVLVVLSLFTTSIVTSLWAISVYNARQREAEFQGMVSATRDVVTDPETDAQLSLTFGFYEYKRRDQLFSEFEPFLQQVANKLKGKTGKTVRIQLRLYKGYELARRALVEGQLDFVRFGPSSYVLAYQQNKNIALIAKEKEQEKWKATFPAHVFVGADSNIRSLDDLRGKRIAFAARDSTAATQYFKALLVDSRIFASDVRFEYLTTQQDVPEAVLDLRFDAGAARWNIYDDAIEKHPRKLQIRHTYYVPTRAWVAREGLEDDVLKDLRECILALDQTSAPNELKEMKVTGFAKASHADYEPVEEVLKKAEEFDNR